MGVINKTAGGGVFCFVSSIASIWLSIYVLQTIVYDYFAYDLPVKGAVGLWLVFMVFARTDLEVRDDPDYYVMGLRFLLLPVIVLVLSKLFLWTLFR